VRSGRQALDALALDAEAPVDHDVGTGRVACACGHAGHARGRYTLIRQQVHELALAACAFVS
jgi:hypothetical protein